MIISRTPLRITLGGGGTDLPHYYRERGEGFLIAAAISKYIYVAINDNFDPEILLKYSEIEKRIKVDDIRHPLFRECIRWSGYADSIEISSMADIPSGTGLGSSGTFAVGLLNALAFRKYEHLSRNDLAALACEIEIEKLDEPVGKQDQYIASYGGVSAFRFRSDESVEVCPVQMSTGTRSLLEENLLLFYTGIKRSAAAVLEKESSPSESRKAVMKNLDLTKELGLQMKETLESADLSQFGELLTAQWRQKYKRQPNEVNSQIDEWISHGLVNGAEGGKLIGAGEGGFLMFYASNRTTLRNEMTQIGLTEVQFNFDYEGSKILVSK